MAKKLWDIEQDLKLAGLIKERESIWNKENPIYFCKRTRQKIFVEIGRALGRKYTASSVRARWTNISLQYKAMLAKCENGMSQIGEPKWHLWEACSFLANISTPNIKMEDVKIKMNGDALPTYEQYIIEDVSNHYTIPPPCDLLANEVLSLLELLRQKMQRVKYGAFAADVSVCLNRMTPSGATKAKEEILEVLSSFSQSYGSLNVIHPV